MRRPETPYTDVLLCGQHNFERVVADAVTAAGVAIEFGTELRRLEPDPEGVTAVLAGVGATPGDERAARFGYVVGCDGINGATRRFTRHDFTPRRTGVGIRQVDCRLRWRRLASTEQMWLFYFDRGFAVVVPLPGGVHRVITVEPKDRIPEREPTLGEMQAKLREVAADPGVTLSDPAWFSYTDLAMGLAPGLRDGRIFLAGDAGNPVLPNGGQGMNTGIADAYDLGWKLAAVIRHGASDALLDTYHQERHLLRRTLQKAQHASLKYTTLSTPKALRAAFRLLAEPALDFGGERRMARAFSELGIHTRRSALTREAAFGGGVRAGDRALDAAVVRRCQPARLYELLYRGGWTLLGFGGRGAAARSPAVAAALRRVAPVGLASFLVSTVAVDGAGPDVLDDLDEEAHRAYGYVRPTLTLVRPDGHVAVRCRPGAVGLLNAYLARWVPDPSQRFEGGPPGPAAP